MKDNYFEIQLGYAKSIVDLIKTLLKSKSIFVKNETLWFLACAIASNQGKRKLSNNLSASFKSKIRGIASDVFCFNLTFVMIELCKPFLISGH